MTQTLTTRPPAIEAMRLDSGVDGLRIAIERCKGAGAPVVYVQGATFPSALAVNWRFADGRSWRDDLSEAGHEVWSFDLLGFGQSDRYPAMARDPQPGPLGRADAAARQIAAVVAEARARTGRAKVSLMAHSWGSMAAGRFAADHPGQVERLILFAPVLQRRLLSAQTPDTLPGWGPMTLEAQWKRFIEDAPPREAPLMTRSMFEPWGAAYLATDPLAESRIPPAVAIPFGPQADILAAWQGELAYDPAAITAPVTVLRGAHDRVCDDDDVAWLRSRLAGAQLTDVKLDRGTHLMHLETGRHRLWAAARQALA